MWRTVQYRAMAGSRGGGLLLQEAIAPVLLGQASWGQGRIEGTLLVAQVLWVLGQPLDRAELDPATASGHPRSVLRLCGDATPGAGLRSCWSHLPLALPAPVGAEAEGVRNTWVCALRGFLDTETLITPLARAASSHLGWGGASGPRDQRPFGTLEAT